MRVTYYTLGKSIGVVSQLNLIYLRLLNSRGDFHLQQFNEQDYLARPLIRML